MVKTSYHIPIITKGEIVPDNKFNIGLVITVASILVSVGGAWGLVNAKVSKIDRLEEVVQINDKKVVKLEVQLDSIDESLKEQKVNLKEVQSDLKTILKAVLEKNR